METVAEGEIQKEMLDPNDVFLVDLGVHLYVWVGDGKEGYCLYLSICCAASWYFWDCVAAGMDEILSLKLCNIF